MNASCRRPFPVDVHRPLIVHSMMKTGTTTIGEIVRNALGYRICGWHPERHNATLRARWDRGSESEADLKLLREQMLKPGCGIYTDFPFGHCPLNNGAYPLGLLVAAWPGARIIWVSRNASEWLPSLRQWEASHGWATTDPKVARAAYEACLQQVRLFQTVRPTQVLMLELGSLNVAKLIEFAAPRECPKLRMDLSESALHVHANKFNHTAALAAAKRFHSPLLYAPGHSQPGKSSRAKNPAR